MAMLGEGFLPRGHAGSLLLGLDFDGTLAPLAARPELARLPARNRILLNRLKLKRSVVVSVISGRAIDDLRRKVEIPGLWYSGNHGLEIDGPHGRWIHPQARTLAALLEPLARDLQETVGLFSGVIVENKGLTLSVHYRNMPRAIPRPPVFAMVKKLVAPYARRLRLTAGHMVWEIRPNIAWDKGHALLKLLQPGRKRWTAAFVGDDQTDEECFRTLGVDALTVRVGYARTSSARFRIRRQQDVSSFLEFILREWP